MEEETARYLDDFARRHPSGDVIGHLESLEDLDVLVVGDAIVDQVSYVLPLARSHREMTVSTRFVAEEQNVGGAVAVANQAACFARSVTLVCALNPDDGYQEYFRSRLRQNVTLAPLLTPDRPTVQKRRFLDRTFRSRIFEIQLLDDSRYPPDLEDRLLELVAGVGEHHLTLAADFGHGVLTPRLRSHLAEEGRFLAVNARTDSANLGFNPVTAYPRADFVCLDELELRLAWQDRHADLEALAMQTARKLHLQRMMVTQGLKGTILFDGEGGWVRNPALLAPVADRTGGFDAAFAVAAPCVFKGVPDDVVGFIGNCVDVLAGELTGDSRPLEAEALLDFVVRLLKR